MMTTQPIDFEYIKIKSNYRYIKYLRSIVAVATACANSILDVGSHSMDLISFTNCKRKVSIDLEFPLIAESVISIRDDFVTHDFQEKFDVVCCFQTLEHINDNDIKVFVQKLLSLSKILLISVPYKWSPGSIGHIQDPIDEEKMMRWFGKGLLFSQLIKDNKYKRLINLYDNGGLTEAIEHLNSGGFCDFFNIEGHCYLSSEKG